MTNISTQPLVTAPTAHVVPLEPSGLARKLSTGQVVPAIDSWASSSVGPLLTPRQQMMADMESLIGVYLQIFVTSRTAAREHNMYLRESVARMVEMEAEKMMSAALMQLVGGVIQGSAGIVSGAMQINGAVSALRSIRNSVKGIEPQMKQESDALAAFKDAQAKYDNAASAQEKQAAQSVVDAAKLHYDSAKAELSQAWVDLRASEDYKSIDAIVAKWNGAGSVTRGGGEVIESGFKYAAAGEDKGRTLLDALKQYLQSSQQSNQDFERDLAEMNRQLLEQLRTMTDRSHQLNMALGQAV
jgi:hypothetical protein